MGRRGLGGLVVVALIGACTASGTTTTSAAPVATTTPPTATTVEATTTTRPPECPQPPYDIGTLPPSVAKNQVPASNIEFDRFTTAPGSSSEIWVTPEGALAVALVRGALPPEQFPGESQRVEIDGVEARVGPFDDGTWVVAWFEQPGDRCDRFTMVFYPPVDPADVQATIESMDRTAG